MKDRNGFVEGPLNIPSYLTEVLDKSLVQTLSKTPLGMGNNVPVFLARFVGTEPDTSDSRLVEFLDVMCRKLSVLRMVRTSYDSDWRMAVDKQPLAKDWWPLMLYLLLMPSITKDSQIEDTLGVELKWVNAALIGIELARQHGALETTLATLDNLAEQRLDTLTVVSI
jgi:hypothetical protein